MSPLATSAVASQRLPRHRGPVSAAVLGWIRTGDPAAAPDLRDADPLGDDVHVALYACYELHYRGFVDAVRDLEWDPALLTVRQSLEGLFLDAVRTALPAGGDPAQELTAEIDALRLPPGRHGVGGTLLSRPDAERMRELLVHRSLYHLKEADPQAWVLPRLEGAAKALVAAVEFDEYGGGDPERMHSTLFADLMRAFDLNPAYGAYLDAVGAPMLSVVNFMSLCGLHRRLRGSLLGQLAVVELTSPLGSQRMVEVVRRLAAGPEAERFYAEHVVADAVHERVMREAIADLVAREPDLTADVVFGIRATTYLEQRLEDHLLDAWSAERSSLRYEL